MVLFSSHIQREKKRNRVVALDKSECLNSRRWPFLISTNSSFVSFWFLLFVQFHFPFCFSYFGNSIACDVFLSLSPHCLRSIFSVLFVHFLQKKKTTSCYFSSVGQFQFNWLCVYLSWFNRFELDKKALLKNNKINNNTKVVIEKSFYSRSFGILRCWCC